MWSTEQKPAILKSFKKIYTCFSCFDIKQTIAQMNKTYASLDFPEHKEYENLYVVSLQ